MYPHNHALTSMLAVSLAAVYFHVTGTTLLMWIMIAGLSALIDLDHLPLLLPYKDKRALVFEVLRNPLETILNMRAFGNRIHSPGFGYMRLVSHTLLSAAACVICYLLIKPVFIPVTVSLATHIMFDILDAALNPGNR